ncbi:uncharacterized protein UV8b_05238 [Ustilaginoidea virens]|uniref:Protein kinase domain-containing protein n=1 Tax=Ustilaginoidea virens TaxID=1159556 RepID=A0A8E5HT23_USTVR|nr:uncharacterized protein UV8b_05238 [Ustilaginoidea virens]QUC20997.1 hypothetical protein UV8b_05238 [Ustilaginoidea virens]
MHPKRRALAPGSAASESLVSFNQAGQAPSSDGTMAVDVGNPLIELRLGTRMAIQTDAVEEVTSSFREETAENYYIANLRNIARRSNEISAVFRARHSLFGDAVVKVVTKLTEPSSIPRIARNWVNEERVIRTVDHPANHQVFTDQTPDYIPYCMDYLPYPDLAASTWIDSGSYFAGTLDHATRVFRQMASALDYLHGKKILHNDIKARKHPLQP